MSKVAVVTDSTACLPARMVREYDIDVIALDVAIDGVNGREGEDFTTSDLTQALQELKQVTTSRPAPERVADEYRRILLEGAEAIVSVHLSSDLSGTVEACRIAAKQLRAEGHEVEVVDSRSLGMGLGYAVRGAARAAAEGLSAADVAQTAWRTGLHTSTFVYVDSLEYLRRSGRVSGMMANMGSRLSVKPLLALVEGQMVRVDMVRTSSKGLARLIELVKSDLPTGGADVAVQHLAAPAPAAQVARALAATPGVNSVMVGELSAVVGAHSGPGTVAVTSCPQEI